ncbi:MAG TPA: FHA domain-containing protein [Chloroflexota bacterium]
MSVDDVLLLGRVAFVVALYLFLLALALLLRRELRTRSLAQGERAPGDLLVMEAGETGMEAGERLPLLSTTTIGRDDGNDIVLDDTFISAQHANITWNGNGWVLQDLGSTNGTRLNGKEVQRAVAVKPGDIVEFGETKFKMVEL